MVFQPCRSLTQAQSEVVSHTYWDTMFYFLISKCTPPFPLYIQLARRSPHFTYRLRQLHASNVRSFPSAPLPTSQLTPRS